MLARNYADFVESFKAIEDPRQDEKILYPLDEVLFMVFVGVLCCQENWPDIIDFCEYRLHILRRYFPYEHGLPSISTLMRVIGLIKASCIEAWLSTHAMNMVETLSDEQIVLDGKSLRGKRKFSHSSKNTHILNVFASHLGLVLAQKAIPEKSGEIRAIKEVLEHADLDGAVVSIDAIGCQKNIANKIHEQGGQYFLALKNNQKTLITDVEYLFTKPELFSDQYDEVDSGHGRIESRKCTVIRDIAWLKAEHPGWNKLTSLVRVISTRIIGDNSSETVKYYISSEASDAKTLAARARRHWSIENNLHWILDVQFGEDGCCIRKDNAAENMSAVRKMVINVVKKYKEKNKLTLSPQKLRKSCAWTEDRMIAILDSWFYSCS